MTGFFQDVRTAMRRLRKSPGFVGIAVLTLALGIGANTAIFSLADLIIRRPVALPGINRLAVVDEQLPDNEERGVSPANYVDLLSQSNSFEQLAAYQYWSASESTQGQPNELRGVKVSANFFSTVGVGPVLGRDFIAEEESPGEDDRILISDALWRQRFGADMSVVGSTLKLDGKPYTVIGVLPARATFPLGAASFWIPLSMDSNMRGERAGLELRTVGRLRPGVSLEQARAEVEMIWKRLAGSYPDANRNRSIATVSLHDSIVLDYNRQFALLLIGVAGLVLLIACTNISAVQFARAAKRRTELAVRTAMGAGRWLLFRQLLVESVLVALAGGALGVLFAFYGVEVLRNTLPSDVRWFCDVNSLRVNVTSLLFAAAVTIAAGLFSGLVPAWQNSRVEISGAIAEGAVRIAGRRNQFWRSAVVVTQTAMATVLLIGGALMVKGFAALANGQSSLEPNSLLIFQITLPQGRYPQAQQIKAFEDSLLAEMRGLPGVRSAALAGGVPYSSYENNVDLIVQGSSEEQAQRPAAMLNPVSTHYFQSVQIPLRDGRDFETSDVSGSQPVCIVSQSMAQRLWPGQSALGKQIKRADASSSGWTTVVGVAANVQHEIYDRSFRSILYLPYEQDPPRAADFVVRSQSDPLQYAAEVRSAVRQLDANLSVEDLQTLSGLIRSQASSLQYVAGLMLAFAVLGLILACVGVYGIMANSVTERWRELAIRMALGAHSRKLLFTIIGRAFLFSAIGIATGLFLSLGLAKLLSSLIYGVGAWDATTFFTVPALLTLVALLACYAPARRALQMDPVATLRYE